MSVPSPAVASSRVVLRRGHVDARRPRRRDRHRGEPRAVDRRRHHHRDAGRRRRHRSRNGTCAWHRARRRACKVADILATPEPGVVVETTGGPAAVSHQLQHDGDFAVEPCTRAAGPSWYFASGTTVPGAEHDLALFNPFGDDAIVDVTFLTDTGVQQPDDLQAVVVPAPLAHHHPGAERGPAPGARRRPGPRPGRPGRRRADARSSTAPCPTRARPARASRCRSARSHPPTRWWFADGTTDNGGTASLSLANFGDHDARVAGARRAGRRPDPGPPVGHRARRAAWSRWNRPLGCRSAPTTRSP